jgi:biotin transport system substrate-specific component
MVDGTTLGSQASMPANTMKTHTDQASPFASRTLPLSRALLLDAARVVLFAALLVLAGQVRFYPPGSLVPVTMQTAVVLLCGFWLRPRLAAAAVGLYLVAGFAVAAVAPGLAWFAAFALGKSTTLGYLFGFFAAAGLVSLITVQFSRLTLGRALAMGLLGMAVIFTCGVAWLTLLTGSLAAALTQGFAPFVPWALAKVGLVAGLVSAWQPRWLR